MTHSPDPLALAEEVLRNHTKQTDGHCRCDKLWPCDVLQVRLARAVKEATPQQWTCKEGHTFAYDEKHGCPVCLHAKLAAANELLKEKTPAAITEKQLKDLRDAIDSKAWVRSDEHKRVLAKLAAAEEQVAEWDALFDLQHRAMVRATKVWQEAHPERPGIHPDLTKMLGWFCDQLTAAEADTGRQVDLLDRMYKAWAREGWEKDGEILHDVLGDVAWEIYDRPDAPRTKHVHAALAHEEESDG